MIRIFANVQCRALLLLLLQLLAMHVLAGSRKPFQKDSSCSTHARLYNKYFGTHQIAPRYSFQPKKHSTVEGAERLLAAGFTSFKFDMQSHPGTSHKMADNAPGQSHTLLQNVLDPTLPNLAIFDMPFRTFMFWLRGGGNYRQESRDLAVFLIRRYRGTNKTFMFGTWKTDYLIRDWAGVGTALIPHPNATTRILQERVVTRKAAWQDQQAGVEDARRQLADLMQGIQVYSYLEVNLVRNGTVRYSVIEDMVPTMRPPPDYISLSLSTLPQYIMSPDPEAVSRRLHPLLDSIAAKLPPNPGIPGPRVFIGEFEFPLRNKYGQTNGDNWTTPTQELQAKHALATLAAAVAWGSPHVMWWELFDNTKVFTMNGTDKAELGIYEDRGFCLVDRNNKDSVLYKSIKQYINQANTWLCDQQQATGGSLPCEDDFRQWSVQTLTTINNKITAGKGQHTRYRAPVVRKQGCVRGPPAKSTRGPWTALQHTSIGDLSSTVLEQGMPGH